MPPLRKFRRRRSDTKARGCPPLSSDLLLEIIARSDVIKIVRCAACCKPLRREILHPAFLRRACHGPSAVVPRRLVGFLNLNRPSFSLLHPPATPAAASLWENHIESFLRRGVTGADGDTYQLTHHNDYKPLISRNGLVLLAGGRICSSQRQDLCVYDPMASGTRCSFLLGPPGILEDQHIYILLTPADEGVTTSSFLLLAFEFSGITVREWGSSSSRPVMVRTFSSDGDGAWSPTTIVSQSQSPPDQDADKRLCDYSAATICGGSIYWLMYRTYNTHDHYIFTYNVLKARAGWIQLPAEIRTGRKLHLASATAGRVRLLALDKLNVSVWLLSGTAGWEQCTVIDMEKTLHSLPLPLSFLSSRASSDVVLLLPFHQFRRRRRQCKVVEQVILLDLETKEIQVVYKNKHAFLYEVDLALRLSAMKAF